MPFTYFVSALFLAVDLCSVASATNSSSKEVQVDGFLYLGGHTAELRESSTADGKRDCAVYFIGPGTPDFAMKGIPEPELSVDQGLIDRVNEYVTHCQRNPSHLRKVKVKGFLYVARGFNMNRGRGNGYGYRGAYRVAILVRDFVFVESR